jgi:hypothetical protein
LCGAIWHLEKNRTQVVINAVPLTNKTSIQQMLADRCNSAKIK